jgi:iron complex transport system permease protein
MTSPLADPRPRARDLRVLGLLLAADLALLLLALAWGSVRLSPGELLAALTAKLAATFTGNFTADPTAGAAADPLALAVLGLRAPRALLALSTGGLLGLSGALLQALLRNPLADPYVLGISGGAACGACAAIVLGLAGPALVLGAGAGALLTLLLLLAVARRALFAAQVRADSGHDSAILLCGVMLAALSAALLGLAMALVPDGTLRSVVFWLLGDLHAAAEPGLAPMAAAALLALVLLALRDAPALTALLGGDLQAHTQGVAVTAVRRRLILVTAGATGVAVSLAGAVGFVGFVAPHLVRRWLGARQGPVLLASTLAGAGLVLLADTLARSLAPPLQLPVGAFTALIGAPLFLWQLQRP